MMKMSGFIKVGKREHLLELRKGLVYCNTLQYFRELKEFSGGMADISEGANFVSSFSTLSIKKNNIWTPILRDGWLSHYAKKFVGNLFCVYHLEIEYLGNGEIEKIDLSSDIINFSQADSFIVIGDKIEFIQRFHKSVHANNEILRNGKVEYLDYRDFHGLITPFNKDKRFAGQNEYRFYIERPTSDKLDYCKYNLGDLSSITSEVFPIEKLNDLGVNEKSLHIWEALQ